MWSWHRSVCWCDWGRERRRMSEFKEYVAVCHFKVLETPSRDGQLRIFGIWSWCRGTRTVQADSDSESRRRSEWGNHSGKPSDSDYLQPLYAPAPINKGHSLCRLSESASETESACTVRVPLRYAVPGSSYVCSACCCCLFAQLVQLCVCVCVCVCR